jgi:hypothetical protein
VVFGEVRYCRETAPRQFDAGIQVEHFFYGSTVLTRGHVSRNHLALFLAGQVSQADHRAIQAHLRVCPQCQADLAALDEGSA